MAQMYKYFISRHANLHVVITMSPIGDVLGEIAHVPCFSELLYWIGSRRAEQALIGRFLLGCGHRGDVKVGVADVCVDMQERVRHGRQMWQRCSAIYGRLLLT